MTTTRKVTYELSADCSHIVFQGREYTTADSTAALEGTPATEYMTKTWKREPGSTEWVEVKCESCGDDKPNDKALDFGDIPDDDCESCQ